MKINAYDLNSNPKDSSEWKACMYVQIEGKKYLIKENPIGIQIMV